MVAGLYATYTIMNAPAAGTVRPTVTSPVKAVTEQLKTYDGRYASYEYPAIFSSQPHPDIISPVIDRQWFSRGNLTGWQLSVTVYDLPSNSLADNGDYNLRKTMPQRFVRNEATTKQGDTAQIFTDTEATSFNKVAFIQRGTTLGAVALTGAAGADDKTLQDVLNIVVTSWHIKPR